MVRYFLEISYLGTNYHGWQRQENAHSIQAEIEDALHTILRDRVGVLGCGRTDTGVHAEQFYLHLDTNYEGFLNCTRRINNCLPKDIAVHKIYEVGAGCHARFNATSRSYRYDIHRAKSPFLHERSALMSYPLDISKMNVASKWLIDKDNFASFCKVGSDVKSTVCHLTKAEWVETANRLHFRVSANRFLRNMVRAMVGTLLDVGRGKLTLEEFKLIVESKDRSEAGASVPACGLYLTEVAYPFL